MFFYGFVTGVICGMFTAKQRKGNFIDMLQYGVGFGIAFGLLAMVAGILWVARGSKAHVPTLFDHLRAPGFRSRCANSSASLKAQERAGHL